MSEYLPTIGLEIHAELRTKTKMFCNSKNDTDEKRPNVNICPVCMGHPGTLPVINKEAVKHVLRVGTAVGGELADYTEFDRKNYFYPDIPKGYQISQYKYPLVKGGELVGVKLTRIHLEEDTAKSSHPEGKSSTSNGADERGSLIDFNRAGVPLMELVTEPVIHDAEMASRFAKELQLMLIALGASHANMEKGEMRVEANISVGKDGALGTKVEVKNLNSFKAVEKAIRYEVARHIELLERGEKVVQETRGWDENAEKTFSQRVKEESHDYRYFPDPDLPKLFISDITEFSSESLRASLPELPAQKRERLVGMGIPAEQAEVFIGDPQKGSYLDEVAVLLKDHTLVGSASNFILTDLKTFIPASELAEVVKMFAEGELSSRGAKDALKIISTEGGTARSVAEKYNLIQKSDTETLKKIAEKIIAENEKAVLEYRSGKAASIQFLIGQAMKEMRGAGNPKVLKEVFEKFLS